MLALVVDYGMSNLKSICRAIEECGGRVQVATLPSDLKKATHIILPGVGSFSDGMNNLNESGLSNAIIEEVTENRIPILGICLGMQLLADCGTEGGEVRGLGLISGKVARLVANHGERIPHVGWNEVYPLSKCQLFDGVRPGCDFYFVHSYHFEPSEHETVVATTPYCGGFVSSVKRGNVYGVQFHPEKSQKPGFSVLRNFLKGFD